jgi:hypothetical protein
MSTGSVVRDACASAGVDARIGHIASLRGDGIGNLHGLFAPWPSSRSTAISKIATTTTTPTTAIPR